VTLRGLCWDHERCSSPMVAAATVWLERTGVEIEWESRPLAAFNEQPLSEVADRYDLLFIDHPFVGTAAHTGCLAPLDELVDTATLASLEAGSVGPSHAAYHYDGHQWALAADAACQMSAERPNVLDRAAPETWDEVLELAREAPGTVAMPLSPADAMCSLLTLCANTGRPVEAEPGGRGVDPNAVSLLAALAAHVDPACFDASPPVLLEQMQDREEIAYIPLTFGYTNYSREDDPDARVRFGNIPSAGDEGPVGSILGGAGIAVSAASRQAEAAAAFAAWISDAEAQQGVVGPAGGQPAHRAAWDDEALDAVCGRFFSGTRDTLEAAWVRPREPWWPAFQREAGELLVSELLARRGAVDIAWELNALLREHREEPDGDAERPPMAGGQGIELPR
jgi:multiple sugar transport system substrate-binding protein